MKFDPRLLNEIIKRCKKNKQVAVRLIYDIEKGYSLVVPYNKDHVDIVLKILKVSKDELKMNPNLAKKLIPVLIVVTYEGVQGIMVGKSSLQGYGVIYDNKDLKDTSNIILVNLDKYKIPRRGGFQSLIREKAA